MFVYILHIAMHITFTLSLLCGVKYTVYTFPLSFAELQSPKQRMKSLSIIQLLIVFIHIFQSKPQLEIMTSGLVPTRLTVVWYSIHQMYFLLNFTMKSFMYVHYQSIVFIQFAHSLLNEWAYVITC